MKTDAYTMCRGAGHIADKVSHLSDAIQAICKLYLSVNASQKRLQARKGHIKQLVNRQPIRITYKFILWMNQAITACLQERSIEFEQVTRLVRATINAPINAPIILANKTGHWEIIE